MPDSKTLCIPKDAESDSEAMEVLRVWTGGEVEYVSITGNLFVDPKTWGHLLSQIARHVGRAYELNGHESQATALHLIRQQFVESCNDPDGTSGELIDPDS